MSEQYFLVRKLGLGKEVVSLSLVVTEVSRGGGMSLGRTDRSVRRSERVNASSDWSDRPVGPTGRSDDRTV